MSNLGELRDVLNDTASDIADVLPDLQYWPDAVLYFLKALEAKASELHPSQQQEFENILRFIIAGLNSRLGEGGWESCHYYGRLVCVLSALWQPARLLAPQHRSDPMHRPRHSTKPECRGEASGAVVSKGEGVKI